MPAKDAIGDSRADLEADAWGYIEATDNPRMGSKNACSPLRPKGLKKKYW